MRGPGGILYHGPHPLTASYLPWEELGEEQRHWSARVLGGEIRLQARGRCGLPCGAAARCVLLGLGTAAILQQSAQVSLLGELPEHVRRWLPVGAPGLREQLERLQGAAFSCELETVPPTCLGSALIDALTEQSAAQGSLLSGVHLAPEYFQGLRQRGVPLRAAAVADLAHAALALDLYAWLARTLPYLPAGEVLIPWASVRELFAAGHIAPQILRGLLEQALGEVRAVYPQARVRLSGQGLLLFPSPPCCE